MSTILHTSPEGQETLIKSGLPAVLRGRPRGERPLYVIDSTPKTICAWGISGDEIRRYSEAIHYLRTRGGGVFITVAVHYEIESFVRNLDRDVRSRIALAQGRAGMRRTLYVVVIEAQPKPHIHIVAIMPNAEEARKLIDSLNNSEALQRAKILGDNTLPVFAEPVMDLVQGKPTTVAVIAVSYFMAETILLVANNPDAATTAAKAAVVGVIGHVNAAIAEGYYNDDKKELVH